MSIVKVRTLRIAMFSAFLFSLHVAATSYVNSTFIASILGTNAVGPIYSVAAILALLGLLFFAPKNIARYGTLFFGIYATALSIGFISLLANGVLPPIIFSATMVLYLAISAVILFNFDVIVEHATKNTETGKIRGIYLTAINLAWMLALLFSGKIVETTGFTGLYAIASILTFFALLALIRGGRGINTTKSHPIAIKKTLHRILGNRNLLAAYTLNFILQFFYAWMVIYVPIHLTQNIGFGWETIGIIFFIMLSPFVFLQYPLGRIADEFFGEKELLIAGLLIMGISTLALANIETASMWTWATILFVTRIGAATVEVMTDSYFFKHVGVEDGSLIGMYRAMGPLAYIGAPLLATIIIAGSGYSALFSMLGLIVLCGLFPALRIRDTK